MVENGMNRQGLPEDASVRHRRR